MSKQCWTRWTWTSEFQGYHILLWSMHAQSTSVRKLIQKIENHPDRHALQQDLRQNKAYNPFSPESKRMIQDVGNVELFELLETDPKTQRKACLSYRSEGIGCCTCGHLLKETVANRSFIVCTMDLLSIPEYVIKKGKTSRPQVWETSRRQRISSGPYFEKEMQKEGLQRNPWSFLARSWFSQRSWSWVWSSLRRDAETQQPQ